MAILKGNKKKTNRKKSAKSKAQRVRSFLRLVFWVSFIVVSVPALSYGGLQLYREMLITPRLEIKVIDVEGTGRVEAQEIIAQTNVQVGQNILSVDLVEAGKAIEGHPWIKSAELKREIPDRVIIKVEEREAVCLVSLDELYVSDNEGVLFKKYSPEDALDLVLVTGLEKDMEDGALILEDGVLAMIDLLKGRASFGLDDVSEIHYDRVYGFSLYTLESGTELILGRDGFEEKLSALDVIINDIGGSCRLAGRVDLTDRNRVVVKFKDAQAKKGGDGRYGKKG